MQTTTGGRGVRRDALLSCSAAVLLLIAVSQCASGDDLSAVTLMPSARMRQNAPTIVWGTVNHGAGATPTGASYQWTFDAPEGVTATPEAGQSLTGVVTTCRDISLEVSVDLGTHLDAHVTARLTVTQGDTTLSRSTLLTVIGANSPDNATEAMALETDRRIAMRRALRFLYAEQNDDGSWGTDTHYGLYGKFGATACVVWAFANAGHTPANQPGTDVYQPALLAAVEYIFAHSTTVELTPYNGYDPDTNDNDIGVKLGSDPATAEWEDLGYSGYSHAMALAALAACKCPTLRTHTGIFDNGGNGTAFSDIIADATDYVLSGAAYGNGGWSYARLSYEPADLSNTSWNIIAMEAAESAGVELPDWLWPLCINFVLSHCMEERWFGYGGMAPDTITPATHMAGVAALTGAAAAGEVCADRTRKVFVRALATIAANWKGVAPLAPNNWDPYCNNHGDGYQMWTVARALRMADITTLHAPAGTFDWQRNRTAADADTEGFWPFLVRTQKEDGSWDNPSILDYATVLDAAWKALCLSKGVVGIPDAVRDVRVTCSLPEDDHVELLRFSVDDTIPAPAVSAEAGQLTLDWMLGDLVPGTAVDLSYMQICRNLIAGESRRVRTSGEILYTAAAAGQRRRHTLAPLDLEVVGTQAVLSITADAQSYEADSLALFTVVAALPVAPLVLERIAPGVGVCRFHAPDDRIMHWLRLDWTGSEETTGGISVRMRTAPAESALARVAWSSVLTAPGNLPGSLQGSWLELEISVEGEATPPALVRVGCAASDASLDVRVRRANGTDLATLSSIPIGSEDWGTTSTHALNWPVSETAVGACLATATLRHGTKTLREAETPFDVTTTPAAAALAAVLSASVTKALQGQAVRVRSEVENT
ncbi:MAG: hypothetical protein KAI66_03825, partial [Lentisphaeria bacterium]|nr:hypothetical protein [Lentisphaeria bacterium]